jgi:hypothetical protein
MMTASPQKPLPVEPQPLIPAQAGIQELQALTLLPWIPAFAGTNS